jgi:hypothetical protein
MHLAGFEAATCVYCKGPTATVTFKLMFVLTNTYGFPLEHHMELLR